MKRFSHYNVEIESDLLIISSESAIVGTHKVPSLHSWYGLYELLPFIGIHIGGSLLVEPQHLFPSEEEREK